MKMETIQIGKYSSRMGRQRKKTLTIGGKSAEEIQKMKEDFYNEVLADNALFKEERRNTVNKMITPKKYFRVYPEQLEDKTENLQIETTQITPEGKQMTEISNINGVTEIKETLIKDTPTQQQKIIKTYQTSNLDKIKPITLSQIMNNEDLIKNINAKSGSTALFVGSSKSGKTTFLIDYINALNETISMLYKKPIIVVFSQTLSVDGGIYNRLPKDTILIDHYEDKIIKTIEKVQKKTNKKYPVILILDDIIDKKNNSTLSKMFNIYRNLNIYSIVLLQRLKMFDKSNRSNVNYVFLLRQNTNEGINDVIEVFLKGIMTNDDYMNATKNYNKIYIDNLNNLVYRLN